jgi:hypothetical protein
LDIEQCGRDSADAILTLMYCAAMAGFDPAMRAMNWCPLRRNFGVTPS